MKVLVIHNFHRKGSSSGDDQVFKSETALLEENGVEVIKYTVSNDEYDNTNITRKLQFINGMLWSKKNYNEIQKIIDKEHPDIVHVHTFFPLLSPSILYASKERGVPVIATLHDTRFICPCATSLRDGKICNDCGDGKYLRMIKYKCFKNSRLQSFLVAGIFSYHKRKRSFYDQIDKYICLNDTQISLLKNIGFDSNKIIKKYNFVKEEDLVLSSNLSVNLPKRYVVFYGRIGEEKGIKVLMNIWNNISEIPIVIMGSGPLDGELKKWAKNKPNVYFLGYTKHEQCLSIVSGCEFIIFPSICNEGCSMTIIESQALRKGVIATDLGFMHEAIRDEYNGFLIPNGEIEKFIKQIQLLWNEPEKCLEIGQNAFEDYQKKYSSQTNFQQIFEIYQKCIHK